MTEKEKQICEMITRNFTLNEIAKELWLSPKQTHLKIQKLINEGYFISPVYYSDGNIRYIFDRQNYTNTVNLKLCDTSKFKALVISDMHLGNSLENISYIHKVYDYAKDKNIHIILNAGDLIDGNFTRGTQITSNIDEQIQRVTEYYPYDRYILNIICFGNHDYTAYENGRDLSVAISQKRPDLISGGYGITLINVLKDQFIMYHPLFHQSYKPLPNKLILEGHHHKMALKIVRNNFFLNIPPLSDLCFASQENPSMIEMELSFSGSFINSGHFKQIGVKRNFEIYSEANLEFFLKHEIIDEKKLILK